MDKLRRLLLKLWEEQSWCPYCRSEHGHVGDCPIDGEWPPDERTCPECGSRVHSEHDPQTGEYANCDGCGRRLGDD